MSLLFLSNAERLFDGYSKSKGNGAIAALTTMLFVFIILALIIAVSYGVSAIIKKIESKKKPRKVDANPSIVTRTPLNLDDEDAVVAALIASIDYRNEIKKDIKVVSIKEIK